MRACALSHLRLFIIAALLPFPALAQQYNEGEMYDRMDKLERDIMTLQRQVARSGATMPAGNVAELGGDAGAAQIQVQLSNLQDELRSLRGATEENAFQTHKTAEELAKLQRDTEARLSALEAKAPAAAETPAAGAETPEAPADKAADKPDKDKAATPALTPPESFATPRELYNYAFRLKTQSRFEESGRYFKAFTEKYPKDLLIGNAYYWLGETYYIRGDYVKAADQFRAGFEALPAGAKAADNLLKLAMSLSALKNTKDACTVLGQIRVKFKDTSPNVVQKASSEYARMGCK